MTHPDPDAIERFAAELRAQVDEARARRGAIGPPGRPDPDFVRSVIDRPIYLVGYDLVESAADFLPVERTVSRQRLRPWHLGYSYEELGLRNPDDDGDDAGMTEHVPEPGGFHEPPWPNPAEDDDEGVATASMVRVTPTGMIIVLQHSEYNNDVQFWEGTWRSIFACACCGYVHVVEVAVCGIEGPGISDDLGGVIDTESRNRLLEPISVHADKHECDDDWG